MEGKIDNEAPSMIKTYFLRKTEIENQEHSTVLARPAEKYLSKEEKERLEAERRTKQLEEEAQWNAQLSTADYVEQCSTDETLHIIIPGDIEEDIMIEDVYQASHAWKAKLRKQHKKHGFPPSETMTSLKMLNQNFGKMSKKHFSITIEINPTPFLLSVVTPMGQVIDLHQMVDVTTPICDIKKMVCNRLFLLLNILSPAI